MERRMGLGTLTRARDHLSMTYGIDAYRFETAYWYVGVDLLQLERRYGRAYKVWAQWRYEHDLPHYPGPQFLSTAQPLEDFPVAMEPGPVDVLAFCGGGKDSLVAMKLLERGGIP